MTERDLAKLAVIKTASVITGIPPNMVAASMGGIRRVVRDAIEVGAEEPDIRADVIASLFPDEYTCTFDGQDIHLQYNGGQDEA